MGGNFGRGEAPANNGGYSGGGAHSTVGGGGSHPTSGNNPTKSGTSASGNKGTSGQSHNSNNNRDRQGSGDKTATEGRRPILLDLDGKGGKIAEFQNSSQFMTGKGGLQHRTSWAGAGDGVLFIDADGNGQISNSHEYVFTEWAGGAADDLDALRKVFDSNGDGKLTSADARWGEFRVLVSQMVGCAAQSNV